jgi:xanthine dehydrogenase small subunit
MTLHFVLNGEPAHAEDHAPTVSLLTWLRESGLTGTKEGCAEGECGACAVALLRRDAAGRAYYESVNSCLLPLASVAGAHVVSVEGVAPPGGALHPVQSALIAHGGSQCGYCTPGFVVSMFAEFYRPDRTAFDLDAIAGNLCRCTGYRPIIDAARQLPAAPADDPKQPALVSAASLARSDRARGPLARTHAAPISPEAAASASPRFLTPRTLDEALACVAAHPEATVIAGGTDLMVGVNQHGTRHERLISLEAVDALRVLRWQPDALIIGAGVTLSLLAQHLAQRADAPALLAQLLPLFASRLIRNRATLGGNLQTASPIGDAAPCLLALDAELVLARAGSAASAPALTRTLPLHAFFTGYRRTALSPGELLTELRVPLPAPRLSRFYKVSKRVLDDISTVACAFALDLDAEGRIRRLAIGCGGVAATPVRAEAVAQLAVGRALDLETLALLSPALEHVGTPLSDARGSAAYRRAMLGRLLEKFWHEAMRVDANGSARARAEVQP